jgi:hypothetical protein
MQQVKYRLVNPGLAPRRTKLEMSDWAGQPEPRTAGVARRLSLSLQNFASRLWSAGGMLAMTSHFPGGA